jgi:hypothetical protein
MHASVNELSKNSSGQMIYQYTPAKDYVGTDLAVISTIAPETNDTDTDHHNHVGGCSHHHDNDNDSEQQQEVIIHFNITPDVITTTATRQSVISH